MEWTRIEKKWHEMARRLQTAGPVVPSTKPADLDRPDAVTPPPDDMAARRLDTRAMA